MFTIAGIGCCLLDYIYARVDFTSSAFGAYRSRLEGDGGLLPGKLVFTEDFESFIDCDLESVLQEITSGKPVDMVNIGGPAVVALIHAAQILDSSRFHVRFIGAIGEDAEGAELCRQIDRTPLGSAGLLKKAGRTPRTVVLSDPTFDQGRGERTFINTIGAAGQLSSEDLDVGFFKANMVVFGGTALVPQLHDSLDQLVLQAKSTGAFTVVNTVYDFRHQRQNPLSRWPLGSSDKSYSSIDLLIADLEEALRLSGTEALDDALNFFIKQGVGAAIVTNGSRDVALKIGCDLYVPQSNSRFPVSQSIVAELIEHPERKGDTTGCGDNFAGGVIAEVAHQLESRQARIDLAKAVAWGAVSGGLACFQMGGVFFELHPEQKRKLMQPYLNAYFQ